MKILLANAEAGSPEWQAIRRERRAVGCSQLAQCLGLDPHRSPLEAFMDISGLTPKRDTESMWAGRTFERACAEVWAERNGRELLSSPGLLEHERLPWLLGTPDFLYRTKSGGLGVLETKWLNEFAESGFEGGQPPLSYYSQVQGYLSLADEFEESTLVAMFGGQRLRAYPLPRDPLYIMEVEESISEWYAKHILAGKPPDPRGEDLALWAKLHPKDTGEIVQLDDGERHLVQELEQVRAMKSAAEKRETTLKAILAARVGDASAALCRDGYGITYKSHDEEHQAKPAQTLTKRVMRITKNGLR